MDVEIMNAGGVITAQVSGRIDSTTAPELDAKISSDVKSAKNFVLDFANVEYISSAGLRVVLAASKVVKGNQGTFKIINTSPLIKEIFDMTGFSEVITIE